MEEGNPGGMSVRDTALMNLIGDRLSQFMAPLQSQLDNLSLRIEEAERSRAANGEQLANTLGPLQEQVMHLSTQFQTFQQPHPPTNHQPPFIENEANTQLPPNDPPEEPITNEITPEPPAVPRTIPRRKPLPDPPKFSGNRREYPSWSQQMRDKLLLDAEFYPTSQERFYLINSCLSQKAQSLVAAFYRAGGTGGRRDPEDFMEYLDRSNEDRNIQARATSSLLERRQKANESFATFLPKFEQHIAEAGGTTWEDKVKITF
ncbi:hypothetical protein LRP88_07350 [Fusarium phalaenopsidis]